MLRLGDRFDLNISECLRFEDHVKNYIEVQMGSEIKETTNWSNYISFKDVKGKTHTLYDLGNYPMGETIYELYVFTRGLSKRIEQPAKHFNLIRVGQLLHILRNPMNMDELIRRDQEDNEYPEIIVCAANRYSYKDEEDNIKTFTVANVRHHACYYDPRVQKLRESGEWMKVEEGFLTNKIDKESKNEYPEYRFVDRWKGLHIHRESGQLKREHSSSYDDDSIELFSEDFC